MPEAILKVIASVERTNFYAVLVLLERVLNGLGTGGVDGTIRPNTRILCLFLKPGAASLLV